MKNLLLKNGSAVLDNQRAENVLLSVENGRINRISEGNETLQTDEEINLANLTVYAGFIDIHNHGAVGVDVNRATTEELHEVSKFLASKGVTAWLPTLVPDSSENYQKRRLRRNKYRNHKPRAVFAPPNWHRNRHRAAENLSERMESRKLQSIAGKRRNF